MKRIALLLLSLASTAACQVGPTCGDGQVDAPEECDGAVLNGQNCLSRGFGAGTLTCTATCKFNLTACGAPTSCGNNTKEGVELCDGTNLGGQTCTSLGLGAGTLKCAANCGGFDTSGCGGGATCGNGKIDTGEACDGALLNGQTCQSQGNDFGSLKCLPNCSGFDPQSCTKKGTRFGAGTKWTIPMAGGDVTQSWNDLYGNDGDLGDFQWATIDMDGDGKPDLVTSSRAYAAPAPSTATINYTHGYPNDPHWLVFFSTGSGFGIGTKWTLPSSGGDTTRGWADTSSFDSDLGDFQWVLVDINGDKKPDIVSPGRSYAAPAPSTATINYPHGWPNDPHWLVFLNTGTGFGTGTKWTIPSAGGDVTQSWHSVSGNDSDVGDFQWQLLDLDGDGKPDLVSSGRAYANPAPSTSTTHYPHGYPSDPHWLIFPNTGSGFGAGTKWTLPSTGGDVTQGWYTTASSDSDVGDFHWSTLDMNGDGKPDLISVGRSYQNPAPSTSTTAYPHGWPSDPHWLFFPNTGSGFGTGAKWTLPSAGGDVQQSWYELGSGQTDVGDFQWVTMDLDGDRKPDLVSHSRAYPNPAPSTSTTAYPHGWPSDPHWLIFPNTGSGFATGAKWLIPSAGGDATQSWYDTASAQADLGDFNWSAVDMNGDGRPDLISGGRWYAQPSPSTGTIKYPHGWPSDAHWLLFPNSQ